MDGRVRQIMDPPPSTPRTSPTARSDPHPTSPGNQASRPARGKMGLQSVVVREFGGGAVPGHPIVRDTRSVLGVQRLCPTFFSPRITVRHDVPRSGARWITSPGVRCLPRWTIVSLDLALAFRRVDGSQTAGRLPGVTRDKRAGSPGGR
jgi:hypothetical protein